ncbi:MAG: Asp-tRNA(Asn)/Glu-tRNA(Gln) amidotransferase subunit GatB [Planctomycetes bacterium]|nr:Asp-tRNA(Asn)/Glu-tRNA(Gln) amidotransferase subunit GatB [Planctomycetota bacterium]
MHNTRYTIHIGFETHLQLKTDSKMFCHCKVTFLERPNSMTCPVCLGMPGSLPALNRKAVELGVKAALLLGARINLRSKFDRKNYFYPDLPKNYQITQYDIPLATEGIVEIKTNDVVKKVFIQRIHLEEDAGKLMHSETQNKSFVDLNRAGVPLAEIVTAPDISSADEAMEYLKRLKVLMRYGDVSNCDMEKGEFRCDVNVSVSKDGKLPEHKSEIKNMNSFRFIKQALAYEISRQIKAIESGEVLTKKTFGFDVEKGATFEMRSKEEAMDYRYFPEPDLSPLIVETEVIDKIRQNLPELPDSRALRFVSEYGISKYQSEIIADDVVLSEDFEYCAKRYNPINIANWVINDVLRLLEEFKLDTSSFSKIRDKFVELVRMFNDKKLTNTVAKEFLQKMLVNGETLDSLLKSVSSESIDLDKIANEVINENPKAIADYKGGKTSSIKFLTGQVMKKAKGMADPNKANEILEKILKGL